MLLYRGHTYRKALSQVAYHVTLAERLPAIQRRGLVPAVPEDMDDISGVYLFRDRESAEDAVMNWLGDRFSDDEDLVLLTVSLTGVPVAPGAGYEWIAQETIPPSSILEIEPL